MQRNFSDFLGMYIYPKTVEFLTKTASSVDQELLNEVNNDPELLERVPI